MQHIHVWETHHITLSVASILSQSNQSYFGQLWYCTITITDIIMLCNIYIYITIYDNYNGYHNVICHLLTKRALMSKNRHPWLLRNPYTTYQLIQRMRILTGQENLWACSPTVWAKRDDLCNFRLNFDAFNNKRRVFECTIIQNSPKCWLKTVAYRPKL